MKNKTVSNRLTFTAEIIQESHSAFDHSNHNRVEFLSSFTHTLSLVWRSITTPSLSMMFTLSTRPCPKNWHLRPQLTTMRRPSSCVSVFVWFFSLLCCHVNCRFRLHDYTSKMQKTKEWNLVTSSCPIAWH